MERHPGKRKISAAQFHSPLDAAGMSPREHLRDLVLAVGGVTEEEAYLLLTILDRLEVIEAALGAAAASDAAQHVVAIWTRDLFIGRDRADRADRARRQTASSCTGESQAAAI